MTIQFDYLDAPYASYGNINDDVELPCDLFELLDLLGLNGECREVEGD